MSNKPTIATTSNNPKAGVRVVVIRSNGTISRVVRKVDGITYQKVCPRDKIYRVDHTQNPIAMFVTVVGDGLGEQPYVYQASDWFSLPPRLTSWLFHAHGLQKQIPQSCGWDGVTTFESVRVRSKLEKFMSGASKGMVEMVACRVGDTLPNWRWDKAKVLSHHELPTTPGTWILWPRYKEAGCVVAQTEELEGVIPAEFAKALFLPKDFNSSIVVYALR